MNEGPRGITQNKRNMTESWMLATKEPCAFGSGSHISCTYSRIRCTASSAIRFKPSAMHLPPVTAW